jgi:hypothetical protein
MRRGSFENRIKWVLPGDENFDNVWRSIGIEGAVMNQNKNAQLRILGKKRLKKRKGSESHLYKRPTKKKTEKRKTLSNSKSEINIELGHKLIEAFNISDDNKEDN